MKAIQKISVMCLSLMISTSFAQIKVASSGNVGVGLTTGVTPLSLLSVGGVGSSAYQGYLTSSLSRTLMIERAGGNLSAGAIVYGVDASTTLTSGSPTYNIGMRGQSFSYTETTNARAYGVLGIAGNGNTGTNSLGANYGVMGQLKGALPGAGICGIVSSSLTPPEVSISGQYAGYFVGNVNTIGVSFADDFIKNSDKRYKINITSLDQPKSLKGILSLNPVEYNLKQRYTKGRKDSVEIDIPYFDEKSQLYTKKHYGLIAQELQTIYPDLVYEKEDGYLAVDYIGLVPVLIQSVKELSAKVEALTPKQPAKTKSAVLNEAGTLNLPCVLYQNSPNPFSVSTTIKYSLSNDITSAEILIFDMQGKLIRTEPLVVNGSGSVTIEGSTLTPGMYIYTLIANGKEIDTKRMILTK